MEEQEHDLALAWEVGLELSTIRDDRTLEGYGTLNHCKLGIREEDALHVKYMLNFERLSTCRIRTVRAQMQTHNLF